MHMIERPQQSEQMRDTGTDYQAVHDLVTCAPDIEAVGIPFFGYLFFVSLSFLFSLPAPLVFIIYHSSALFEYVTYSHSVQRSPR